jgi:methyltransferase (TIGR00027 family)
MDPARSSPSLTARVVALARSRLERPRTDTGDPDAEERLYASLRSSILLPVGARFERRMAARTAFFDEVTLAAITAGMTQVVIVGAGYDGRALRFCSPGVRYFEVDQSITQQDKRRRIQELGVPAATITFLAHDLAHGNLASALCHAGHLADRQSLFICEGLLLYLERAVIERLLCELRGCAAPESWLALSARELAPGASWLASARSGLLRALLAAAGEPRRSLFGPDELTQLLERAGWAVIRQRASVRGGRKRMLALAETRETASAR